MQPTSSEPSFASEPTVVAESRGEWAAVWVGFPALGAAAGLALTPISNWMVSLPWAFMQGPFRLVNHLAGPTFTIAAVVVGAVAGLVLAAIGAAERLTVTVSGRGVTLRRDGTDRHVDRAAVAGAFRDGKDLVLHGPSAEEVAREKADLSTAELAAAFRAHGYRWHDADPFAADFRLWVRDAPGLPDGADAVLAARRRAIEKNEQEEAAELRTELARLGVVVRDEKKRQYWRRVSG